MRCWAATVLEFLMCTFLHTNNSTLRHMRHTYYNNWTVGEFRYYGAEWFFLIAKRSLLFSRMQAATNALTNLSFSHSSIDSFALSTLQHISHFYRVNWLILYCIKKWIATVRAHTLKVCFFFFSNLNNKPQWRHISIVVFFLSFSVFFVVFDLLFSSPPYIWRVCF